MKKSLRNIQIGGVFSMLVLGFAFWTLLLQPQMEVPAMREAEATSYREQFAEVDKKVLDLMMIESDYSAQTDEAEALNVKMPQALEQYSFIDQIRSLAAGKGINPSSLDISISGSLAPVNSEALTESSVYSVPVSILVRSNSPATLVEFANALHDSPRMLSISTMSMGVSAELGGYEMTISGAIYAAPLLPTEPTQAPSVEELSPEA